MCERELRREREMSDYEDDYESYSYGEGEWEGGEGDGGGGEGGREAFQYDPYLPFLTEGLLLPAAAMATGVAGAAAGGCK